MSVPLPRSDVGSTSGQWLGVYLLVVIFVSGAWIGSLSLVPLAWIAIVALAAVVSTREIPLEISSSDRPTLSTRDWMFAAIAAAPVLAFLAITWAQEFPYGGDQSFHNGAALEAFAFWWWLPWISGVAALVVIISRPKLSLPALILLALIGIAAGPALVFAGRYPGTLHFAAVPLHALPFRSPLNAERLINTLSIPMWLLVLRPWIIGRAAGWSTLAAGLFLFWQKDVVYYFSSGYLEPWAIVLLLTAGEHLVRFDSKMLWRPLLLLGAAAMVKEHVIFSLPVIAFFYFPFRGSWRERLHHLAITGVSIAPFCLFFLLRMSFRPSQGLLPVAVAFSGSHLAAFADRVGVQFGAALPAVIGAVVALLVLGFRRRAFAALLVAAAADWFFFFSAGVQQPWVGYPRTNLVPLAYAAIALGHLCERVAGRSRSVAVGLIGIVALLNGLELAPFLRAGTQPDSVRNFTEHSDAPIFYPIREAIARAESAGLISPHQPIALLNNGKRIFSLFYPGPIQEQYPDLAARYHASVQSFAGDPKRCRCSGQATNVALFIHFTNLGASLPQRAIIESEGDQCRQEMLATCRRTLPVENEGVVVGMVGSR
ncbi:MAG TPA: hypothetical protein VEZ11_14715 [Thermoanaerobaculia bacterium]|nr:hypothetical protein [Thermoanaerobaculia bacterium]